MGGSSLNARIWPLLVLLTLVPLPTGAADALVDLDVHGTKLPSGRVGPVAVWTGSEVLVFGGHHAFTSKLSETVHYDPVTGGVRRGPSLPSAPGWGWAHWDGKQAHIGSGYTGVATKVSRYDPATEKMSTSTNYQVLPRSHAAAVSVGNTVYLFGGVDTSAIRTYDPALDLWVELPTKLPTSRFGMAAAQVGPYIYLFGGHTNRYNGSEGRTFDEILRFDPASGELVSMNAKLPTPNTFLGAYSDGTRIHLFGGETANVLRDQILLYDPESDTLQVTPQRLPQPRKLMAVVGTPHGAFLIGGYSNNPYAYETPSADILRYDPASGAVDEQRVLLPTALNLMPGVWNTQHLDLFGGYDGRLHDSIHRYDPALRDLIRAPGALPTPMAAVAAAYHNGTTYLFGGIRSVNHGSDARPYTLSSEILAYDTSTGEVSVHTTSLPEPRGYLAAVAHRDHIYVIGGVRLDQDGVVHWTSDFYRFTPATGELLTMPTLLNSSYRYVAAASSDEHLYLLTRGPDQPVQRYDPASGELTSVPLTLPSYWPDRHGIFWTGEAIHVIGAHAMVCDDPENGCPPTVAYESVAYVPDTGKVYAGAKLDHVCCGFATWAGDRAYIYGTRDPCADRYKCNLNLARRNVYEYQVSPGAPQNVTARATDTGLLRLEWSAPRTAGTMPLTGYRVHHVEGYTRTLVAQLGLDTPHYEAALPPAGERVTFDVTAVSALGAGRATRLTYETPPGPPTTPVSLTSGLGETADSIRLTWLPPTHDGGHVVEGYRLYRASADAPLELVAELGSVTSYNDTALPLASSFRYALTAWNALGEGPAAEVDGTTAMPPSAPSTVSAKGGPGAGQITVTWQAPSRTDKLPIDTYTVYVWNGTGWELLVDVPGNVTSHVHDGLADATSHSYVVTATTAAGEGDISATVTATTFSPPSWPRDLKATPTGWPGQILLTWKPPARDGGTPIAAYQVYRATDNGQMEHIATVTRGTRFVDDDRSMGEWYRYQVTATNVVGEGRPSAVVRSMGTDVHIPVGLFMVAVLAPRLLRKP